MSNYLRVARFSKYIQKELIFKVFLGLCITATYVIQAVFLAKGTALVFEREFLGKAVFCYLSVAGLIVVRALLVRYLEGYSKKMAGKIKTVLREMIIGKLLLLGPGYQSDKRSGKMQSLVTDGVEYLEPYLVNYIPQVFIVALSVIPMVVYICSLSFEAGLILILAVLLAIFMPHLMMPLVTKACIGYWREYAVLNAQYVDTMQGMNTLKLFSAEKMKGQELAENSESFRSRQLTNTRNSLFLLLRSFL